MLPSVYVETSIVSYLVARPSSDAAMARRQRETRDGWQNRRGEFRLFSSRFTLREVLRGEPAMERERAAAMKHVVLLRTPRDVEILSRWSRTDRCRQRPGQIRCTSPWPR